MFFRCYAISETVKLTVSTDLQSLDSTNLPTYRPSGSTEPFSHTTIEISLVDHELVILTAREMAGITL